MQASLPPGLGTMGDDDDNILVGRLRRIIHGRARVAVRRWPGQRVGPLDADDVTQEILALLFANDRKKLREWDKTRSSLESYVSIFAQTRILDIQRKELHRLNLFGRPVELDDAPDLAASERPDEIAIARDQARAIEACVRAAFPTRLGQSMIDLLLVWRVGTTEACRRSRKTRAQVFRWRSKLRLQERECWNELFHDDDDDSP